MAERNYEFKHFSNDKVAKRSYRKKDSWLHIKDYVISERERGQKPKAIRLSLKGRGISIERCQLQDLMKKWTVAQKNLRPGQKKYILEAEDRAETKGRHIRGWYSVVGNSRIRVSQTQLDSARKIRHTLEDVKASPGLLVPSPMDILNSPHPDGREGSLVESVREDEPSDREMSDNESVQSRQNDDSLMLEEAHADSVMRISECDSDDEGMCDELVDDIDDGLSDADSIMRISECNGDDERMCDEEVDDSNDDFSDADWESLSDESSPELSQDTASESITRSISDEFSESVALVLRKARRPQQGGSTDEFSDLLTPEQFVEYLHVTYRQDHEDYLEGIIEGQRMFVQEVDRLRASTQMTLFQCEDVALDRVFSSGYADSYKAAQYMTNGGWVEFVTSKGVVGSRQLEREILQLYYGQIFELWWAMGADNAPLTTRSGKPISGSHKTGMRRQLVHLPQLIRTVGLAHWATLSALYVLAEFCDNYWDSNPPHGDVLLRMVEFVVDVNELFGFSDMLASRYENLFHLYRHCGRGQAAASLGRKWLDGAQRRHGAHDLRTLYASSHLLRAYLITSAHDDTKRLSAYIRFQIKALKPSEWEQRLYKFIINTILLNLIHAQEFQLVKRLTSVLKLGSQFLHSPQIAKAEFTLNSDAYITFETSKAEAYYRLGNLSQSMQALFNATQRFSDIFHELYYSTNTIQLATEVMTARGMVRYSAPILGRWIQACEEEGDPESNPYYQKLLFAAAVVEFPSEIQDQTAESLSVYYAPKSPILQGEVLSFE